MREEQTTSKTRKTRIVCVSDTHGQTPKLPKGDVLIHAGDLTNQGSYSELRKTVEWLEKADFEAKIVVAGNHDITLDAPFYAEHGSLWRWPRAQDPDECRKLLTASASITYLENEAATIYLTSLEGPHTCFTVYGSPYSPKKHNWAFQYEAGEAMKLWDGIPDDADIVVTHTPPKGHCDKATKDDRSGCEALLQALHRVRPMLAVCGHIHEARAVERMSWNLGVSEGGGLVPLVKEVEKWEDPGVGNQKQSLVNLTAAGGRSLENSSRLTRQAVLLQDQGILLPNGDFGGQPGEFSRMEPIVFRWNSGPARAGALHNNNNNEAKARFGRTVDHGQERDIRDLGMAQRQAEDDVEAHERRETAVINAAILGPRIAGKGMQNNKPIVVDVELPLWNLEKDAR